MEYQGGSVGLIVALQTTCSCVHRFNRLWLWFSVCSLAYASHTLYWWFYRTSRQSRSRTLKLHIYIHIYPWPSRSRNVPTCSKIILTSETRFSTVCEIDEMFRELFFPMTEYTLESSTIFRINGLCSDIQEGWACRSSWINIKIHRPVDARSSEAWVLNQILF